VYRTEYSAESAGTLLSSLKPGAAYRIRCIALDQDSDVKSLPPCEPSSLYRHARKRGLGLGSQGAAGRGGAGLEQRKRGHAPLRNVARRTLARFTVHGSSLAAIHSTWQVVATAEAEVATLDDARLPVASELVATERAYVRQVNE